MSSAAPVIALLGFGEAGSAFGRDLLRRGVTVRVYDPKVVAERPAVATDSEADAARGADLVLSVNSAHDAPGALASGIPGVEPHAAWADMNTASPKAKQQLAATAREHGIPFADIAIMAPVPGKGWSVPMLVSGSAAEPVANMLRELGARIDVQPGQAGAAAQRKLLRSVFFKGLAAAVYEALEAGRAAGCEQWLHDHLVEERQ
ncbi:MAG: NAD(P)-dependent oxidoreductase [Propionibacteriales bacterium]|nr:NAD(P)-dependent oxidoreductase [Propionibacteriales bacterium]